MIPNDSVPDDLRQAIQDGRCVAFVGAGFSGASNLPGWAALLKALAQSPQIAHIRDSLLNKLESPTAADYEEVAQHLALGLGRQNFIQQLRALLRSPAVPEAMRSRIALLHGIPFHCILTTNFDDLLPGHLPGSHAFRAVLRSTRSLRGSLYGSYCRTRSSGGVATIKLHGDLSVPDSVVFSRTDYRKRLYSSPGYLAFLRAVFLNYTILYLGFSFTDAYLNELRSEALSILGNDFDRPAAYALVNDVPEWTREHFRVVEGIEILTYATIGNNFSGFDDWLRAIHSATNPVVRFGALLDGKRILWVDANHDSVEYLAQQFFADAAGLAGGTGCDVEYSSDAANAIARLGEGKYDLVISHWGYRQDQASTAVRLLTEIRQKDIRVPALIFSTRDHAEERKPEALRLGAQGYYYSNVALLQAIEHIFTPGDETG